MGYDTSSYYPMGFDPHSMHGAPYSDPTNMYLPTPVLSASVSHNPSEYEQEINAFLRHTTSSSSHKENDSSSKSNRNHYHHKTSSSSSSRHRSKSRERRR